MNKYFLIGLALYLGLICASGVSADTLYLKNGVQIKGKVTERGAYYVVIQEKDKISKYFMSEIDRIVEDRKHTSISSGGSYVDVSQFDDIPQEKVYLILQFIELTGMRQIMEKNVDDFMVNVSPDKADRFLEVFDIGEIISRMVPIYDSHYTEDEIRELNKFYSSPIGRKMLMESPLIVKDIMQVSVEYFAEKVQALQQE